MKKTLRLTLMAAIIVTMIMATAAIVSATTYTYSREITNKAGDTIKLEADTDLSKPVRAGSNKTVYFRISTLNGKAFGDYSEITTPNNSSGDPLYTYGKTSYEDAVTLNQLGSYTLDISGGKSSDSDYEFSLLVNSKNEDVGVIAKLPSKIKIWSTPTTIYFNKKYVDYVTCGTTVLIQEKGTTDYSKLDSTTGDSGYLGKFKPNKKYTFNIMSGNLIGNTLYYGSGILTKTVPTGPSVKPVIKSVKVSNFKVKKFWSYNDLEWKYTSSYTLTVKLSKKASKTKGVVVTLGNGETRKVKGTGKTFKMGFNSTTNHSEKGTKMGVKVKTYSNNTYMCYSDDSKTKKITIK